ncbi:hypothetical protein [Actinomyces massiliensis]|uniref:hypothetical protein n=1 Tax=Actinomyces massiliensis TaxID=461393 RepID=UPI0028E51D1A|nr:hypothetical protein [Actinomyces massiliensis]
MSPQVIREELVTSHGRVRCSVCCRTIARGTTYMAQTNADEGTVYTWRECDGCNAAATYVHDYVSPWRIDEEGLSPEDYHDGRRVPVRASRTEKGVDVLCALALVDLARSGLYDVVVLASRDTDLAPCTRQRRPHHQHEDRGRQVVRPGQSPHARQHPYPEAAVDHFDDQGPLHRQPRPETLPLT